ncbi:MAG TPA: PIN domain-containing protein [Polyangiaceae bacterium]|nr:PIN domain-containing protein [Polyangiaceae bacterium]
MAALVDTNILVYRFDSRDRSKQRIVQDLLRDGIKHDSLRVPHQAILEFVAALSKLWSPADARREAEELVNQFPVLYPNEAILRLALRGAAAYQFSWFDAHIWAYAEHYALGELISEDFQHNRMYGSVRVINPFV